MPISGDSGDNVLTGTAGDESIYGLDGNDTLSGGGGSDVLYGGNGNDTLIGDGADVLLGGPGDDTLNGSVGSNAASYQEATSGVTVNLALTTAQAVGGGQGSDTLISIASLVGSNFDDVLIGNDGGNALQGRDGNDLLEGGPGGDMLDGGQGSDTVSYAHATGGVTVSLAVTTVQSVGGGQDGDVLTSIENLNGSAYDDTLTGSSRSNVLAGGAGNDRLSGGDGVDTLNGGIGNDTLDGGVDVDTAAFSGNSWDYTITQSTTGNFTVSGLDGTDTLTNVEYAKFDDQTVRLLPGNGATVNFAADPATYMGAIRDFDGVDLGGAASWKLIGTADINGDGRAEQILFNRQIGRWAEVGTEGDGKTYFSNYGWAGNTRVVGIYIDPLVANGTVVKDSDFDSQRRFQNDLMIDNIHGILGQGDYNKDGLQEVYFSLTDGTAYLHAYMHADGNIQYANYQNQQQVIDYLTSNGVASSTWATWFPVAQTAPLLAMGG